MTDEKREELSWYEQIGMEEALDEFQRRDREGIGLTEYEQGYYSALARVATECNW